MKSPFTIFSRFILLLSALLCASRLHAVETFTLNGDWQAAESGGNNWIPAKVPGCIHTDLLAAGKIPDPFYRDNEKLVQWVGETNWTYRRTFVVPPELLQHDRLLLHCDGLDTLATVRVNGRELGHTDNMFRVWEFDVKPVLVAGTNTIEITFDSPLPVMRQRNGERPLYEWIGSHEPAGRAWVRKEPCNFGWDWGPVLITCGIWHDIKLVAFDEARLNDVAILQDHSVKDQVTLKVNVNAETVGAASLEALIDIRQSGRVVDKTIVKLDGGTAASTLTIKHPKLWWPAGMGLQPLYDVRVDLLDGKRKLLDRSEKRIGLRTVEVLAPDKTNSLRFAVNGITFFAKGANWIPADPFPNRVPKEKLRSYVRDAVAVNMNTLRFWGGGHYEEPALFDACDEMGILVWLDFKFGCSSYPAFDAAFMENVRQEVRDNVKQLRHHPSIAVWCGNNEISLMTKPEWSTNSMGQADYDKLFSGLIGGEVKSLAPQANYVPGSPEVGDIHSWQVWHGDKPFETYRELSGFMSEFGFQSFPAPATIKTFTEESDRSSLLTPVLQWHQRSSGNGNKKIQDTTARYFHEPKDFESAVWLSQILQGYGIKTGAEYWRQDRPRSMGCVFWQFNDNWPVTSWSSVDYSGNWKALQYLARHFYAPVLVSGIEDATNETVAIHLTSDLLNAAKTKVTWEVTDTAGVALLKGATNLTFPAQSSQLVKTLDLRELVRAHTAGNLLVWLKAETHSQTVSENLVTLVRPKDLALVNPNLHASIKKSGKSFRMRITADKPALWSWLELKNMKARYSDNFVHIKAGAVAEIWVAPDSDLSLKEFQNNLVIRSLVDTYN